MKYWIPRLRELAKKNVRRCVTCKQLEGKFYEPPPAPPLPDFRVSDNPPFTNVGLDFIGPLLTRTADKNEIQKSYICLFTCTSSRGLHLEACESLNISSFRLLFRRYCSRRGLPMLLISDNASTFKSAEKEIRKIVRSRELSLPRGKELSGKQGCKMDLYNSQGLLDGRHLRKDGKECKKMFKKDVRQVFVDIQRVTDNFL